MTIRKTFLHILFPYRNVKFKSMIDRRENVVGGGGDMSLMLLHRLPRKILNIESPEKSQFSRSATVAANE